MKTMKKIFASLLVLCMVLALPNMTVFADATGTEESPEVITTTSGTATQAEDQDGYWYSYVATVTGYYAVGSLESKGGYETGSYIINKDTGVGSEYDKIFVSAGDTVVFKVASMEYDYSSSEWPTPYFNKADTITWQLEITEIPAIESLGEHTTTVEADNDEYNYYYYTIPEEFEGLGIFSLEIDAEATTEGVYYAAMVKNVNTDESDSCGNSEWSGFDASASVKASAGQTILVGVMSFGDGAEETGYPEFSVVMNLAFAASGTEENPEIIDTMYQYGSYAYGDTLEVNGGSSYVYKYVSEMNGEFTIRFRYDDNWMTEEDESVIQQALAKPDVVITVTNEKGTTTYTYSTQAVEKTEYGETYKLLSFNVAQDDVIVINVKSGAEATEKVTLPWEVAILEPAGAESNPYSIPDGQTSLTVDVVAGQAFYIMMGTSYQGYNLTITAEGKEFQVMTSNGPVSAENGVVTIPLAAGRGGIQTAINNLEETDVTYTLTFEAPIGTEGNPDEITFAEGEESGKGTHAFEYVDTSNGAATGFEYYFKWVATETGYVRITASATYEGEERSYYVFEDGATTPSKVIVEGDVWYYYAENTAEDGDVVYSFSKETEDGMKVSNGQLLYVEEGDVVMVRLMALDATTGLFVDSTVEVELEYVDLATGSEESAIGAIENFEPVTDDYGNPLEEQPPVEITILDKDGNLTGAVGKEILEAAKEAGLDITFLVAEDVAWLILGDTLGDTLADVDLSVVGDVTIPEKLMEALVGEEDGYTISIAHDGAFGFTAQLAVVVGDADDNYTNMYANLFWYNEETGKLEFQAAYEMEDANVAVFEMTHASDYVIVMTEEAMSAEDNISEDDLKEDDTTTPGGSEDDTTTPGGSEEDTATPGGSEEDTTTPGGSDKVPETGDFSNVMIYMVVLLGAAFVATGFVAKKRFA